ncbi:MAG: TIGR00730 family Rossman fold protein [Thermoanaerobaculia bacterium]
MPFTNRPMIAVFCGSRTGVSPRHAEEAEALGREIAAQGAGLVYGGGRIGLMGLLADAVLEAGAPVHGVIPAGLAGKEIAHHGLTRLDVVATMHERKARMSEHVAGFIAMAGGFGTLDEFFEIVTWKQLGHHDRPIVLLNGHGYWTPLVAVFEGMTREGFVSPALPFTVEQTPADAVRRIVAAARPSPGILTASAR